MANLVLDASAVIRIIEGAEVGASFAEAVLSADLVLAPELMLTEVANALWRLQRAGQLAADGLQQRLARAADLVDAIEPDRHLQVEALALACHLDHPVYDSSIWPWPAEKRPRCSRLISACRTWPTRCSPDRGWLHTGSSCHDPPDHPSRSDLRGRPPRHGGQCHLPRV